MFARVRVASITSSAASSTGPAAPPRRLRLVEPRLPALRRGRLSFANCVGGANAAAAAPASSVAAASRSNAMGCDGNGISAAAASYLSNAQPLIQMPLNHPPAPTYLGEQSLLTCPAAGRLRGRRVHAVAKMMRDMVGGGCGPDGANPLAKMMQGSGGGLPHRTLSRLRVLRACSLSRTDADRAPHMQAELRPRRVRRSFKGSIMAGTTLCSR